MLNFRVMGEFVFKNHEKKLNTKKSPSHIVRRASQSYLLELKPKWRWPLVLRCEKKRIAPLCPLKQTPPLRRCEPKNLAQSRKAKIASASLRSPKHVAPLRHCEKKPRTLKQTLTTLVCSHINKKAVMTLSTPSLQPL